ncbi:hypothetical protein K1719_009445 [Acacia pycnantha]|nr:hypothetical protein K1719_009445 [Acacia pycnantha]
MTEDGERVKLACVNWVSHLEPLIAEGLSKQPVDVNSKKIKSMGFNCVRFTWLILLVSDQRYRGLKPEKGPPFVLLQLSSAFVAVPKEFSRQRLSLVFKFVAVHRACFGYSSSVLSVLLFLSVRAIRAVSSRRSRGSFSP